MIRRSRANRTERATFRNIRNEHKFIDVVHHGDGHYYMIQYIKHGKVADIDDRKKVV